MPTKKKNRTPSNGARRPVAKFVKVQTVKRPGNVIRSVAVVPSMTGGGLTYRVYDGSEPSVDDVPLWIKRGRGLGFGGQVDDALVEEVLQLGLTSLLDEDLPAREPSRNGDEEKRADTNGKRTHARSIPARVRQARSVLFTRGIRADLLEEVLAWEQATVKLVEKAAV